MSQEQEQNITNEGAETDGALAQQQQNDPAATAGAARLKTMVSPALWDQYQKARSAVAAGKVTSTPGAAGVAAKGMSASPEADPAVEARRKALTRELALDKTLTPEARKAKTAELQKLIASQATQAEADAFANLPLAQLRERHGITEPPPKFLVDAGWDTESEAVFLAYAHEQGLPTDTTRAVYRWYVTQAIGNGGAFSEADADAFKAFATKRGLSKEQVEKLIAWHTDP